MNIYSLEQILSANLSWNTARIKFLSRFLIALFQVQTVNLAKIASVFAGEAKISSNYKTAKIHAFFDFTSRDGAVDLKLLKIESPFVIAIDRTEWQLGKSWVNVLMLSAGYKNISIPLFWIVLEKKGCSDNSERTAVLQEFINKFGAESIRFVTADREFASKEWLRYLVERKIPYRLRIKANASITDKRGKLIRASKMLKTLKSGQRMEFRRRRKLWNQPVFVAVCRKADGDNVIVISSERSGRILLEYGMRWQIESLFGCLKTRGFQLEDTHLTNGERISKLLSLLTLSTIWALLSGEMASQEIPTKIKKHGRLEKAFSALDLRRSETASAKS